MIKLYGMKNILPAKIWVEDEDDIIDNRKLSDEIINLRKLPYAKKHIALMADAHASGFGVPIGSVVATENILVPDLVSNDIACGVRYRQYKNEPGKVEDIRPVLSQLLEKIEEKIPLGSNHRDPHINDKYSERLGSFIENNYHEYDKFIRLSNNNKGSYEGSTTNVAYKQLASNIATLGGGNHFIEIQVTEDNEIAIMIHTGSRYIGHLVYKFFSDKAQELNERWYIDTLVDNLKFNYLPKNSRWGQEYWNWMNFAKKFAEFNRDFIMDIIVDEFDKLTDIEDSEHRYDLNISHNYVDYENIKGTNYLVHRKGAVRARESDIVPIPGAMGSCSYIARGKGADSSFHSCSHGAGRSHSRTEAKEEFTEEELRDHLLENDISYRIPAEGRDEYFKAYKDIDNVINNQSDLIKPLEKLKTLAVVKG